MAVDALQSPEPALNCPRCIVFLSIARRHGLETHCRCGATVTPDGRFRLGDEGEPEPVEPDLVLVAPVAPSVTPADPSDTRARARDCGAVPQNAVGRLLADCEAMARWDSAASPPPSGVVRPGWDGCVGGGARWNDRGPVGGVAARGGQLRLRLNALGVRGANDSRWLAILRELATVGALAHQAWPLPSAGVEAVRFAAALGAREDVPPVAPLPPRPTEAERHAHQADVKARRAARDAALAHAQAQYDAEARALTALQGLLRVAWLGLALEVPPPAPVSDAACAAAVLEWLVARARVLVDAAMPLDEKPGRPVAEVLPGQLAQAFTDPAQWVRWHPTAPDKPARDASHDAREVYRVARERYDAAADAGRTGKELHGTELLNLALRAWFGGRS